jgi:DNA-directed RNA polymerase subunit RPC12/RpoP
MRNLLQYDLARKLFRELDDAVSLMETFENLSGPEFKERLQRKVDLLNDIDEMDVGFEICDKCGKILDMRKNEDIWLELLDMVLCGPCHSEHKGIEKYWSQSSLEEYQKNQTVSEWCPHCENEVELEQRFESQSCPNCRIKILPCAQCLTQDCGNCPLTGNEAHI